MADRAAAARRGKHGRAGDPPEGCAGRSWLRRQRGDLTTRWCATASAASSRPAANSVATRLLGQVRQPAREPLSQRELDILGLISQGCSNREAAARLFISEATVKTHVLHIYAKLGVNDRAAAVAAGFERGLLPRP